MRLCARYMGGEAASFQPFRFPPLCLKSYPGSPEAVLMSRTDILDRLQVCKQVIKKTEDSNAISNGSRVTTFRLFSLPLSIF